MKYTVKEIEWLGDDVSNSDEKEKCYYLDGCNFYIGKKNGKKQVLAVIEQ